MKFFSSAVDSFRMDQFKKLVDSLEKAALSKNRPIVIGEKERFNTTLHGLLNYAGTKEYGIINRDGDIGYIHYFNSENINNIDTINIDEVPNYYDNMSILEDYFPAWVLIEERIPSDLTEVLSTKNNFNSLLEKKIMGENAAEFLIHRLQKVEEKNKNLGKINYLARNKDGFEFKTPYAEYSEISCEINNRYTKVKALLLMAIYDIKKYHGLSE